MKTRLLLSVIMLLTLTACSKSVRDAATSLYYPNGHYCQKITHELHLDPHHHHPGWKLTDTRKAKLMKEYKYYKCDQHQN